MGWKTGHHTKSSHQTLENKGPSKAQRRSTWTTQKSSFDASFRKHPFHPPDPLDQLISRSIPRAHHYAIRQFNHNHTVQLNLFDLELLSIVTRLFHVFIDCGIPFHSMWPPLSMESVSVQFIIAPCSLCYLLLAPEYHVCWVVTDKHHSYTQTANLNSCSFS